MKQKIKQNETVADLFKIAIAAESAAMNFYKLLAGSFSHARRVSLFWEDMMSDEASHIRELMDIRNKLPEEELLEPADAVILNNAKNELKKFTVKCDLKNVVTLDDAYEIAYELEYSEVNAVFGSIISRFATGESKTKFVLSQVREHVSKLEEFSKSIAGCNDRRNIMARHP